MNEKPRPEIKGTKVEELVLGRCGSLLLTKADYAEAEACIKAWHYSHTLNTIVPYSFALREAGGGMFGDRGAIVAVVCFAFPVNRNAKAGSLELVRLARHPDGHPDLRLSYLVSEGLKWLRLNTDYKIVISYADWTHGHHGGIYQATNFYFVAVSKGGVQGFADEEGQLVHKRTAYDKFGTSSVRELKFGRGMKTIKSKQKFLYAFPLVKGEKARLAMLREYGYEPLRYPKPDWPDGMNPPEGTPDVRRKHEQRGTDTTEPSADETGRRTGAV